MTTTPKTATYYFVRTVVYAFMALTAVISFMHIVHTAEMLGLTTWERWTVPALIDGFAALGLIGRSARFAPSTRRAGTAITIGAGLLSLACNVMAGESLGGRIYGALVVAVFITAEWYGTKLAPATVTVEPTAEETAAAELAAKRSAAAVKAAATRKANRTAAEKAERAETRRIRAAARALEASAA
jgi:hypothetical protein